MKYLLLTAILISMTSCLSSQFMKLASEYSASVTFFDYAHENLREINSLCEYDKSCFIEQASEEIDQVLCPSYENYNFVSEKECQRAGQEVIDRILGNTEIVVPIINITQNTHNDQMYELEREKIEMWKEEQRLYEQQIQHDLARQAEQQRQHTLSLEQELQRRQDLVTTCRATVASRFDQMVAEELDECVRQRLANRSRYGSLEAPCSHIRAGKYARLRAELILRCNSL